MSRNGDIKTRREEEPYIFLIIRTVLQQGSPLLVYYTESSEQLVELLGSYIRVENAVYRLFMEEL